MIIGAQKAGTTSLFEDLARDPRVVAPLRKEVHYFDLNAAEPEGWYRSFFARESRLRRGDAMAIEATPYYLFHPHAAERARRVIPSARLVVLLRDPVERAFSHWRHNRRLGTEPLEFVDALHAEGDRLAGESERLADPGYVSPAHQRFSYAARGRYAEQLERWRGRFPEEQLLVVDTAALFGADHEAVRHRIREFAGLATDGPLPPAPAANVSPAAEIPAPARAWLEDAFTESNRRLATLLGEAAPAWSAR